MCGIFWHGIIKLMKFKFSKWQLHKNWSTVLIRNTVYILNQGWANYGPEFKSSLPRLFMRTQPHPFTLRVEQGYFFWPRPWHAEVPGPRMKPKPRQWAEPKQWQCQILNLLDHQGTPYVLGTLILDMKCFKQARHRFSPYELTDSGEDIIKYL